MPNSRFSLALWVLASLLPAASAISQDSERSAVISLESLREKGIHGFEALPPRSTGIVSEPTGAVDSGWAIPLEPDQEIEFALTKSDSLEGAGWTPVLDSGGIIERTTKVEWSLRGGAFSTSAHGGYRLRAPRLPGNYGFSLQVTTEIRRGEGLLPAPAPLVFQATILVKAPFDRHGKGMIRGYPVGIYPNENGNGATSFVARNPSLYAPPQSFILSNAQIERLPISKHFVLRDFVPRAEQGRPNYIALDPRLVQVLELLIEKLEPIYGEAADDRPVKVLTGFLAPTHVNQLNAEGVRLPVFTRFQYGDGASVVWDTNSDGIMDDLDRDGNVDIKDARALADHLARMQRELGKFGGIGAAAAPKIPGLPQTPYVDVDMRGVSSRW